MGDAKRKSRTAWLSILGSESVAVSSDYCYYLGFPVSVYSKVSAIILIFLTGSTPSCSESFMGKLGA